MPTLWTAQQTLLKRVNFFKLSQFINFGTLFKIGSNRNRSWAVAGFASSAFIRRWHSADGHSRQFTADYCSTVNRGDVVAGEFECGRESSSSGSTLLAPTLFATMSPLTEGLSPPLLSRDWFTFIKESHTAEAKSVYLRQAVWYERSHRLSALLLAAALTLPTGYCVAIDISSSLTPPLLPSSSSPPSAASSSVLSSSLSPALSAIASATCSPPRHQQLLRPWPSDPWLPFEGPSLLPIN